MIKIEISEQEVEQINYLRYHHPHPTVQKRMWVLYLINLKIRQEDIAVICDVSREAVIKYKKLWNKGGLELIQKVSFNKPKSDLLEHQQSLEDYFREHPPKNIEAARDLIEELTGIRRGITQTRSFLKTIGIRFKYKGASTRKKNT